MTLRKKKKWEENANSNEENEGENGIKNEVNKKNSVKEVNQNFRKIEKKSEKYSTNFIKFKFDQLFDYQQSLFS